MADPMGSGGPAAAGRRFCERCRAEIPPERVEVLPETRICVACSRAVGGEFDLQIVPENVGKAGSLKKNYGSWTASKVRKPVRPPG